MYMNDRMKQVAAGIQAQSFARLLDLHVEAAEEGSVVISCRKRPDLLQQTGLLHGGVTGALCEAAAGYAALTVLPEGQSVIGVEYKLNFLRAITAETAVAKARVIKQGRQLIVVEVDTYNAGSDKLAAKMIFTGTPVQG